MEAKIRFPLELDKLVAAVAYLTEHSRNDEHFCFSKLVKMLCATRIAPRTFGPAGPSRA